MVDKTELRLELQELTTEEILNRFEERQNALDDDALVIYATVLEKRRAARRVSRCKSCRSVNKYGLLRCTSCGVPLVLVGKPAEPSTIEAMHICGTCGSAKVEDRKPYWNGRAVLVCMDCGDETPGEVLIEGVAGLTAAAVFFMAAGYVGVVYEVYIMGAALMLLGAGIAGRTLSKLFERSGRGSPMGNQTERETDFLIDRLEDESDHMGDPELHALIEDLVRRGAARRISACKECEAANPAVADRCARCRKPLVVFGAPAADGTVPPAFVCPKCHTGRLIRREWTFGLVKTLRCLHCRAIVKP